MSSTDTDGILQFPEELADRETWLEPFDWYRTMREDEPVRYDPDRNSWDVFRYADVKRVLDDEAFSVNPRNASDFVESEAMGEGLFLEAMHLQDPPRHDELRSVVDSPFSPRALGEMEPRIQDLVSDLLDDALAADEGRFDVVEEFAYPLPVIVIAEILGVPPEERDRFKRWSDAVVAVTSPDDHPDAASEAGTDPLQEMSTYLLQQLDARKENPKDDLMTTLVTGDEADRLDTQEALGMCALLMVAGNVTTTNFLANAIRCFGNHDLVEPLREGSLELATVLEEVLRYRSPVQAMERIATRDIELGGEQIEAGDGIVAWIGSANRDERQFDAPEEFRPERSPTSHLAFGHGTHYCLGATLARLEGRIALSELLDRCNSVEPVETTLEPTRSSFVYGVESLPVEYTR